MGWTKSLSLPSCVAHFTLELAHFRGHIILWKKEIHDAAKTIEIRA